MSNIAVFDPSGKLIKQEVVKVDNSHPHKLLIKNPSGIYYVRIQSESSTETLKLEIEQ